MSVDQWYLYEAEVTIKHQNLKFYEERCSTRTLYICLLFTVIVNCWKMKFGSCLSLVQMLQWDTGTPAGWTALSSFCQLRNFWVYEEQISSAASTCCHLTPPDLWVAQNFTSGETETGIQSASWASTFWTKWNRDTTSIPKECFKKRYDRPIYKVLSFFDQGLSHQLVAINDHNPPAKNTKCEMFPYFSANWTERADWCFGSTLSWHPQLGP